MSRINPTSPFPSISTGGSLACYRSIFFIRDKKTKRISQIAILTIRIDLETTDNLHHFSLNNGSKMIVRITTSHLRFQLDVVVMDINREGPLPPKKRRRLQ